MNACLIPRSVRLETQLLLVEAAAAPLASLAQQALRTGETWMLPGHGGKLSALASMLTTRHGALTRAAILLSPAVARGERELSERTRVAGIVLKQLMRTGSGELLFVTAANAQREVRQELLALVDVFLTELGDVPIVISALFLEAPRAARTHRSAFEAALS